MKPSMVKKARVMHYMNQFFAGMGGEDKTDMPVESREGPLGPGKRLQELLGDFAEIVVTTYCGDNYFPQHQDEALEKILQIAKEHDVDMVVAGPAFFAGRYGFACVEICHAVSTSLGLYCVTGMFPENPAVATYMQYKGRKVFALPTGDAVSRMGEALEKMAGLVCKLAAGSAIGSASKEGYIPRGFRVRVATGKTGAERALDMLLDKMAGRPFVTEILVESLEPVSIPPPITDLKGAYVVLASTSGVVPLGNPDKFARHYNKQWRKYPIDKLNSMTDTNWDVAHGGYFTGHMKNNPNYGVPLDVARELEREGVFSKLYPFFYLTVGNLTPIENMMVVGEEIAKDLKAEGVDAILLVST